MNSYRYAATVSAIALAFCQTAVSQPSEAKPDTPGVEAPGAAPRILQGNDRVIAPAKPLPQSTGSAISFNFEEAPVSEVVRTILGDVVKADYVLHPPLAGSITLSTKSPVAPDQALFLLETALQANGLALLRDARGSYHVGRPDALKAIGGAVRQASGATLPPGYGAIIVPLQYIGASEMAAILKPLMPAEGLVRVDTVRNLLVLSGTRTQAEAWLDLVATFDVDLLKGMSVGVFPLKHATTKEIETALRLVSGGGAPASGNTTAAATAATQAMGASGGGAGNTSLTEGNPLFGALRIMPIERINSVLVVTPRAAYLEEARRWIERLDQPNDSSSEPQLFIYQVKNVNARHLASVLSGIFGDSRQTSSSNSGVAPGLTSATGGTTGAFGQTNSNNPFSSTSSARTTSAFGTSSGLGTTSNTGISRNNGNVSNTATQTPVAATLGSIRVMADELNNSVLVWSTRSEFSKIETTLKRLDLPLTQVLIEASIIEVTLGDGLEYGLQWAFSGDARSGYRGVGQISGLDGGLLGGLGKGFTYQLSNSAGTLKAVLNGLASKSLMKVISSPNLMVLDNHTATINVGNQVPIVTSSTTYDTASVPTTSTVQYKDTGVNLVVTPSVNSGNVVTMQVDQITTDVGEGSSSANNQPTFMQRQISSKVAVRSGESIVLGELIKDNTTTSKSGVPFLQDVPVVGKLFGTNASQSNRTELLVIITPRVVRTDVDIREVSEDLRERMRGLQQIKGVNASRTDAMPAAPVGATRGVDPQ